MRYNYTPSFLLALILALLVAMSHSSQCDDPGSNPPISATTDSASRASEKSNPDDATNRPSQLLLGVDAETNSKDPGLIDKSIEAFERKMQSLGINLKYAMYILILILAIVICIPICCCIACCGCCCCTIAACCQGLCKCLTCCCPKLNCCKSKEKVQVVAEK